MSVEDDFIDISSRTWSRTVESIAKNGFLEGASAGRDSAFQDSFDLGYAEGFKYGMDIGFHRALKRATQQDGDVVAVSDSQRVNCQLCVNQNLLQQHVINVDNTQKESNAQKLAQVRDIMRDALDQAGVHYSEANKVTG